MVSLFHFLSLLLLITAVALYKLFLTLHERDKTTKATMEDISSPLLETSTSDSSYCRCESKTISWEDLSLTIKEKQKTKSILSNVSGVAQSGQLTCIIGPSGSGKTSLLSALGGRVNSTSRVGAKSPAFDGQIKINNTPVANKKLRLRHDVRIGFVGQEDSLPEASTPREAIRFSGRLRLSRDTTEEEILLITRDILTNLKLQKVQNQVISSLSGGERRRVSLAIEFVTRPQVLLLDEITSGAWL